MGHQIRLANEDTALPNAQTTMTATSAVLVADPEEALAAAADAQSPSLSKRQKHKFRRQVRAATPKH